MTVETADVLILGAGVCGMAAATQMGDRAIVVERANRPGGLVRSHRLGDWWFDEVLHLLYFSDDETGRLVKTMMGENLKYCPPEAFCVTPAGTTRYPFQMHLGALHSLDVIATCVRDLAKVTFGPGLTQPPHNYRDVLEASHGRGLCDAFLFPYNRKTWKRPIEELAPSDFQWNIPKPDFEQVLHGALEPERQYRSYNAHGYYPCPPINAAVRGMEVLSLALSHHIASLRTEHEVLEIDIDARRVYTRHMQDTRVFEYRHACLSTLPLPRALKLVRQTPKGLQTRLKELTSNRVDMVYFAVDGPRPRDSGHWRYYSDETIVFGRLVFMHAFDPWTAPLTGWGLMAEITARSEDPAADPAVLITQCENDARAVGALSPEHRIVASSVRTVDPAYVVFTPTNISIMEEGRAFLTSHGVTPLGRYGRWEYSSMSQVMRDGFNVGRKWADQLDIEAPQELRWNPPRIPGER